MADDPKLTYVPTEPFKVGEYNGDDILIFGAYRVQLADGFVHLSPHQGFRGTVSEAPLPLDDPDVKARLIEDATAAKEAAE